MYSQLQVTTPEGVTFKHDLAGIGARFIATLVDLLVLLAFAILLLIVVLITSMALSTLGVSGYLFATIYFLCLFFAAWGYHTVMEARQAGSVGYKVAGIKVVTRRGSSPMFWQCAVRGLFWPFEAVLFATIAFVSIVSTQNSQRLADLVAGTMVVHRNSDASLGKLVLQQAALDPNAEFRSWEISQVSDDEVYLIRRFLERRISLPPSTRLALANRLYRLIVPKVSSIPTDWYSEAVLEGIAASKTVANER